VRSPLKVAAVMLLLAYGTVWAQAPQPTASPPPGTSAPSREEVQAAIAKLRLDPNLGQEHTIRTLHWKDSNKPAPPPADAPTWLMGLFDYMGQAGSLLMWLGGAILAACVIVWSFRYFKARSPSTKLARSPPVSHVGDLDIRPDSLPEDVGAAALALLNAGRVRDALSLLYRGALSRAVHGFGVAIQESHTEGEALRVVVAGLDASRADYFRELVGLWQGAVYAGQPAPIAPVAALCSTFAAKLGDRA
jgi:hypothetical protein